MGFAELHFHLLPGADDGPRRMNESMELARAAVAEGTTVITSTPHIHPAHITNPGEVAPRVRELIARLQRESIRLEVRPGGELLHGMVHRLDAGQLELIAQGPADGRWLLLEGLISGLDADFTAAADRLRVLGFGVVLAHPERYRPTAETRAAIEHEIDAGSALQFNARSFTGHNGETARAIALDLLRRAPTSVVASDAHGAERPPALGPALEALRAAGVPDPARLVSEMPRQLLHRGLVSGAVAAAV